MWLLDKIKIFNLKPEPDFIVLGVEIIDKRKDKRKSLDEMPLIVCPGEPPETIIAISLCRYCGAADVLLNKNKHGQLEITTT